MTKNMQKEKYNTKNNKKIFIVIIMDGASDHLRIMNRSPLELAQTPYLNKITKEGFVGLVQTLYPDLPKDSVVAQLGLLGYDPYKYFPKGRSFFEVPNNVEVREDDLIFRVNLVFMDQNNVLKSYNGSGVNSEEARKIVDIINVKSEKLFPEFKLYNISDFRNTLVIKNAGKLKFDLKYYEPHEEEGKCFDLDRLIYSESKSPFVDRINDYISFAKKNINSLKVNNIFPWGYSHPINLPKFSENLKSCFIGNMDFLNGFANQMGFDFCKIGNSNWDTDYKDKGKNTMRKIDEGYDFIYCHINGPDEASHMNDVKKKIFSIEQIDQHILKPIFSYFERFPGKLGAVAICPDHYTNIRNDSDSATRRDAHSIDPVPFLVWDGKRKDKVKDFSENSALTGLYGSTVISHLDLLGLMGLSKEKLSKQKDKSFL